MLQIDPQTKLPIVRQLQNPADVTGYYVRAVVRNSLTKTVISTIDLDDDGGGRFTGAYLVPSTEGLYFDITTKVYTDAGYTTPATTYGNESESFLGSLRWSLQYWNSGQGGADVNYKKIEEIFTKVLGKYEFLSKEDVFEIVDGAKKAISGSIHDVEKRVAEIDIPEVEIPEPKEVDLSFLQDSVNRIFPIIEDIKIDTETIVDNEATISRQISLIEQVIESAKQEIVLKQEEMNGEERQKEVQKANNERDMALNQLLDIQKSVSGLAATPIMQKEQKNEMDLRVKRFIK